MLHIPESEAVYGAFVPYGDAKQLVGLLVCTDAGAVLFWENLALGSSVSATLDLGFSQDETLQCFEATSVIT